MRSSNNDGPARTKMVFVPLRMRVQPTKCMFYPERRCDDQKTWDDHQGLTTVPTKPSADALHGAGARDGQQAGLQDQGLSPAQSHSSGESQRKYVGKISGEWDMNSMIPAEIGMFLGFSFALRMMERPGKKNTDFAVEFE